VAPLLQRSDAVLHSLVGRLLDYVSFGLDVAGAIIGQAPDAALIPGASKRDVRERFVKLVDNVAQLLWRLSTATVQHVLSQHLAGLPPQRAHHHFHKDVIQAVCRTQKDPQAFYAAFFANISRDFDVLLADGGCAMLLDLQKGMAQKAFVPEVAGASFPRSSCRCSRRGRGCSAGGRRSARGSASSWAASGARRSR
jgi:hypothetical protein